MEPKLHLYIFRTGSEGCISNNYVGLLDMSIGERMRFLHVQTYEGLSLKEFSDAVIVVNKHRGNDAQLRAKLEGIVSGKISLIK